MPEKRTYDEVMRECEEWAEEAAREQMRVTRERGNEVPWGEIYWPTLAGILRARVRHLMGEGP